MKINNQQTNKKTATTKNFADLIKESINNNKNKKKNLLFFLDSSCLRETRIIDETKDKQDGKTTELTFLGLCVMRKKDKRMAH